MSARDQHVLIGHQKYKTKDAWLNAARSIPGSSIWYWGTNSATLEIQSDQGEKRTIKSFWVSKSDAEMSGMEAGGFINCPVN